MTVLEAFVYRVSNGGICTRSICNPDSESFSWFGKQSKTAKYANSAKQCKKTGALVLSAVSTLLLKESIIIYAMSLMAVVALINVILCFNIIHKEYILWMYDWIEHKYSVEINPHSQVLASSVCKHNINNMFGQLVRND